MIELVLVGTPGSEYPRVPAKIVYQSRTDYISPARCLKACRGGATCATRAGPAVRRVGSGGAMWLHPLTHHGGKSGPTMTLLHLASTHTLTQLPQAL
jgi:hypothetical protein